MKNLILINTNTECSNFINNRYIVERTFDPDASTKSKVVLFYENDKMKIHVVKTRCDYQIFVIKNKNYYIRMSSHLCYTKAKEDMLNIIKDIEKCDVYGFIQDPNFEYFEHYSNDAIIEKYGLQLIN